MSDDWPAVWRPREDWARPTYADGSYLVEQVERGAQWIRDHYSTGGDFRCPSGSDE